MPAATPTQLRGEVMTSAAYSAARQEAAAQIRRDNPRWVVIWSARKSEYQARPLFRANCVVTAATPQELTERMSQVRQASPLSDRSGIANPALLPPSTTQSEGPHGRRS